MVDDLLGEFQVVANASEEQKEKLEEQDKEIKSVQEQLKDLDAVKEKMNKSVSTEDMKELQDKLNSLQTVTEGLQVHYVSDDTALLCYSFLWCPCHLLAGINSNSHLLIF